MDTGQSRGEPTKKRRPITSDLTPTPLVQSNGASNVVLKEEPAIGRFRVFHVSWHLIGLVFRALCIWVTMTRLIRPFMRRTDQLTRIGVLARDFCERMGVLWVKVGQLLALRTDFMPPEVCDELLKLQDRTSGFPSDEAIAIVERELGGPIAQFFSVFEREPFAAASTAQLHRAQLKKQGMWVAVKVQRPDLQKKFETDIALVRLLFAMVQRTIAAVSFMSLDDFLAEVDDIIREEIDYRYEAANMRRMRKILKRHKVKVAKVYRKYTTQRVLVMEYITGVLMSDYLRELRKDPEKVQRWCEDNNVDPDRVGRELVYSINRQIYEDQLFHADLHPGNIILLRDSRFAFIDFGSVGFLDVDFLRIYEFFVQSLVAGEHAKAVDFFLLLQKSVPANLLGDLKDEMIRVLDNWQTRTSLKNLPYMDRSILSLFTDLPKVAAKYRMPANWEFLRVGRSFSTVDGSLIELKPDADFIKLSRQYLRAKYRRQAKQLAKLKWLKPSSNLRNVMEVMASMLNENIMLRGATLRRMAQVFDSSSNKVSTFFTSPMLRISLYTIFAAIGYLFLTFLFQHNPDWIARRGIRVPDGLGFDLVPYLDIQVWAILFVVAVYTFHSFFVFGQRLRSLEGEG